MLAVRAATILSNTARAWNDEGHMIIAALAYDKLDSDVRGRVDVLVKVNPQYKPWVSAVAKAKKGKMAFMKAATWPDFIKNAPGYTNDKDSTGPDASRNIGYADKLQHRYWHYKDLPFSKDGTPTKDATVPNATTQIDAFRAVLSSSDATDDLKSYDLVWLLPHRGSEVVQRSEAASGPTKTDRCQSTVAAVVRMRHPERRQWYGCLGAIAGAGRHGGSTDLRVSSSSKLLT